MAKTKEELSRLKEEYDSLKSSLKELSEEEIIEVTGGDAINVDVFNTWEVIPTLQTYKKDIGSDKNAKVIFK